MTRTEKQHLSASQSDTGTTTDSEARARNMIDSSTTVYKVYR
jgi:hypothetical protein